MRKMYLMTMVFALFVAGTAKAQITDVYAGNDTIELRVGNYQYGFVQWQISHDTVNWTDIEGATDTIYRFLPTEKAYYRAEASFANCPPEFSKICYVQLPPKADAGPDRKLAEGDGATMFALLEEGCVGEWEIIEGHGGSLSDLHSPNAYFEGTDSEYRLKWTVTNACGSNSDTVCIKYLHTVMNDNFLIVDTTDFILSDSTQLLDGLYIIAFSDSITVTDSTLLVGVGDAPFLRKVQSFTYDESTNTYTFHTNQGTLADFLIEGVFSLDFSSILNDGRKVVVSDRYPTRKDIAELGWSGVYVKQPKQDGKGLRWNTEIGEPKLKWTPGNFSLPYDFEVIPTFTMESPNFMCELEKTGWHVESFKFGLYNTAYMTSYQVYFPGKTSFSLKKKLPVLPKLPFPPIFIGPVEVTLQLSCDLNLKLEYSLGPDMSYYVVQRGFLCNYIMYDDVNGWTANSGRIDRRYDFDADWPEYGDVSAKVSLDLKLSFLFYSFIGPYAGFSLGFEGTHGTFGAGFTAEQFKVKEEYKLGAKMTVLGYDIMDFDWPFITHDLLNYQNPYSMQMKGGNHQVYIPGQPLPTALSVLVKKSNGKPSKGVRVKFETTDGDLSPEGTFTDNNGIATTNWTPATNSSGNLQAKAYSYNVKNEPVQGAPMVFSALHSEACSSLSVNAVYKNGLLKPQASGGTSPYLFSTDGVAYGLAPTIIPVQGLTYHFYVRDANQCTAECYYTHPSFSCLSSDLDLALVQRGNTLVAYATGGTAPYEFSLNDGAFVSSPLFNNLANGTYAVTVRDANGCTAMDEMTIELENSTVQVTTLPVVEAEGVVTFKANIANVAGTPVVGKGFCYGRHHVPDFSAIVVSCGDGDGDYSSFVTNTEVGVAYYVRAYVSTNNGVAWGNEVRFTGTGSLMASLYDDFNDGVINTDLWTALGADVYEEEGLLKMEQNITDDLVGVWSRPLTVPASNQVVIDRSFMLHRANNHFDGPLLFGFNESEPSHWLNCGFRVEYYHEDYQGLYGTYLVFRWNGEDMEKIRLCDAVYDMWVTERVVFDVAAKTISYYRDNDFVAMVDLPNELRQIDIAFYTVAFRPYGWWTGHYHYMDYVDINHAGNQTSYAIATVCNPSNGGTANGGGIFQQGQQCTLTATANNGYTFANWTENGNVVSTEANYSFIVNGNRNLVANFVNDGGGNNPTGAIKGKFTINSNGDQVRFSQGNLQYQASTDTWRFAENQWDYVGEANANISPTYDGWIDLFGWGTGDNPTNTSTNINDYSTFTDWGSNPISNGGNQSNLWRTLSNDEWKYLLVNRNTMSGVRYVKAKVNGVNGLIVLPDDWNSTYSFNNENAGNVGYESNVISNEDWSVISNQGAIFLPTGGLRVGTQIEHFGSFCNYWSASNYNNGNSYYLRVTDNSVDVNFYNDRYGGRSVRLVAEE